MYAALLGRFCSRDPVGYVAGVNIYEYVWDSPTTRSDPPGLQAFPPGFSLPDLSRDDHLAERVRAYEKIAALCNCECLECTEEECLAEARQIADAYVGMFYRRRRLNPRPFGDYRSGWMCYQWQTLTFNELEDFVSGGKCFDMARVGSWTYEQDDPPCDPCRGYVPVFPSRVDVVIGHNWVAISAVRGKHGSQRVPAGECTVYLDPWKNNSPCAFSSDGGHSTHNCVLSFCNGPDGRPTGGVYICIEEGGGTFFQEFCGWRW